MADQQLYKKLRPVPIYKGSDKQLKQIFDDLRNNNELIKKELERLQKEKQDG